MVMPMRFEMIFFKREIHRIYANKASVLGMCEILSRRLSLCVNGLDFSTVFCIILLWERNYSSLEKLDHD